MSNILNNLRKALFILSFISLTGNFLFAQDSSGCFLRPAEKYNKKRVIYFTASAATAYIGTMYLLNQYWYKDYPRSAFHFFDDNGEWKQMDKCGHVFNSYKLSQLGYSMNRWTGVSENKSVWIGGSIGVAYMSIIEILDGFSKEWGFSYGD